MKRLILPVAALALLTAGLFADAPATPPPQEEGAAHASAATEPQTVIRVATVVPRERVTRDLEAILEAADHLDPDTFQSAYLQKTFVSRLSTAVHRLAGGRDAAAVSQLRSILRTTDGCVALHRPDRNDWVLDCEAQEQLHGGIYRIIALTEGLE